MLHFVRYDENKFFLINWLTLYIKIVAAHTCMCRDNEML